MATTFESLIPDILAGMGKRQASIIRKRFGIPDGTVATLAQLGAEYGITRERVRQIEAAALETIKANIYANPNGKRLVESVRAYLSRHGDARRETDMAADLCGTADTTAVFTFFLTACGAFTLRREDEGFHAFWCANDGIPMRIESFLNTLERDVTNKKEAILANKKEFSVALARAAGQAGISSAVAENYLAISKRFGRNPHGDIGLSAWPEILPKTMRDRAYLILKKDKTPLHFQTIAQRINELKFTNPKLAHPSTVHNELIKDKRFVLVGRGTYSLAEHGYVPGTAKDVIARILKKHGSLPADRIVQLVQQERLFQKNTILLNLQNKKLFRRQQDGAYRTTMA